MSSLYKRLDEMAEDEMAERQQERESDSKRLEIYTQDMKKLLPKLGKIELAVKSVQGKVGKLADRANELEEEVEDCIAGQAKRQQGTIQKDIDKDKGTLQGLFEPIEKAALGVIGEARQLVERLTKIRDKGFAKTRGGFEKRFRDVAGMYDAVESQYQDALSTLLHCDNLFKRGQKTMDEQQRKERCLDLVDMYRDQVYDAFLAPESLRREVAGFLTQAKAVVAFSDKSGDLSERDIAELEKIKEEVTRNAPHVAQFARKLASLFKTITRELKPYADIKEASQFLKKLGDDVKTVAKDFDKWRKVEPGMLKRIDALLLQVVEK
jgi:hypothetical protein